jgi:hypothetical protein
MSSRTDIRKIIGSKVGGQEFLAKLDAGKNVTGEEITQYFSPLEQQNLIESETSNLLSTASQQIDPNTGKSFAGDRLIERASQIYIAGTNIPIDSQVSDVSSGNTIKEYSEKANTKYSQNLQSMNCF